MPQPLKILAAVSSLITLCSAHVLGQCDDWRAGPLIDIPGTNGPVFCSTMWDPDGSGPLPPQLVIGGNFTTASGTVVNCIARWDGTAWQPFGSGMTSTQSPGVDVTALAVLPASFGSMAGQLVAGGYFTSAGGVAANSLARWDGSAWHALGSGAMYDHPVEAGTVGAMIVAPPGSGPFSGHLIVGGFFDSVAGVPCDFIAHWDGSTWASVGTGLDAGDVYSVTMWDPDGAGPAPLQPVVTGLLFLPDAPNLERTLATWNGTSWNQVASQSFWTEPPLDYALAVTTIPPGNGAFSGQLVAGGVPSDYYYGDPNEPALYRWDGAAWQDFGDVRGIVHTLGAWDTDGSGPLPTQLVAGGEMTSASGATISPGVARWDGTQWQSVGAGFDGAVYTLASWDPDGSGPALPQLVAGGNFLDSGSSTLNYISHFSSGSWQKFTEAVTNAQVFAITPFASRLAAAGSFSFTSASNATPNNVVTWDGLNLGELGSGTNGTIHALVSFSTGSGLSQQNHLVAGGEFTTAGGATALRISEWSESPFTAFPPPAWTALGSGLSGNVFALERFNNQIYAGGDFIASGDLSTSLGRIALWNGSNWVQPGSGLNGSCNALKVYNGQLYVGGSFTTAGGLGSGGLARWNGTSWSIVGGNFIGTVDALEIFNGDLIIGGSYSGITGNPNIAKYNSTSGTYAVLGSGGTDGAVRSLLSENGALYIGGDFTHVGGVAATHFARWNDTAWSSVRGGTDGSVYALAGLENEVHAGGTFSNVRNAAINSPGWARYSETGAPWIAQQPIPEELTCGSEASFTCRSAAGYGGLVYTWRHDGTPLVNGPTGTGSIIGGATGATIDIVNLSDADAGTYDCVISNGCGAGTSLGATLTVDAGPAPTINTQPIATRTCASGAGSFSISAASGGGGALTYQWQIETTPGTFVSFGGSAVSLPCGGTATATTPTAAATQIAIGNCTGDFNVRCELSNACGLTISNTAALRVCNIVADLTCDGVVDLSDLSILLSNYGTGTTAAQGDLNGDHQVNLSDLAIALSNYGASCP